MTTSGLELVEKYRLPCLVRTPRTQTHIANPLLCFLHGYDEGAPTDIFIGLTRHGPLRPSNPEICIARFVVVAPQLPSRGDIWYSHLEAVREIALNECRRFCCDERRLYLTGFSFGANGAFDLALAQSKLWAAVLAVDPTRVPSQALPVPVWVAFGEASRATKQAFVERLGLLETESSERVWKDEGLDHAGTATRAYSDSRTYDWLLRWSLEETDTAQP